jgi:PKD repeat protein
MDILAAMKRLIALLATFLLTRLAGAQVQPPAPELWHPKPGDNPATFGILISPGVAPAVVHVDGLNCPIPVGTPLTTRYDWDFGDSHGKYNTLTGFNAAHLYDYPGTYTITLKVTGEDGRVRTSTGSVIITANARKQFFVANGGSDGNDGLTPNTPFSSVKHAFDKLIDGSEIRLMAGGTFEANSALVVKKSDVLIGRYGPGPDPVLMLSRVDGTKQHGVISIDSKCSGVLIERITIDSPYGVADDAEAPKVGIEGIVARGRDISVREVTFLNIDTGVNANGFPNGLLVQDCRSPGKTTLRAYMIWGQGTNHVYLGNLCANSTREHCIRLSSLDHVLVYHNDFTNLDRRPADKYDYSKGAIEMHRGTYAYIAGNTVRDGTIRVGPLALHGEDPSSATDWSVIENNRVIDTEIFVKPGSHHVMIRNNLVFFSGAGHAIDVVGPDGDGRTSRDISILNNTAVDLSTKGMFLKVWGHVDAGITLADNLFVAPHLDPGTDGTSAVNTEMPDLADFKAVSHNVWPVLANAADGKVFVIARQGKTAAEWKAMPQVSGESFADVDVDAEGVPTTNAAAIDAGDRQPAVPLDRNGVARPTTRPSAGAVQLVGNKSR